MYREGVVVQHNLGQYFMALRDTAQDPNGEDFAGSSDWTRVGSAGLRLAPPFSEGRQYRDGDLFVKDFSLFAWWAGEAWLVASRGRPGDPGRKGEVGSPGRDGRDGATVEAFELRDTRLALVVRQGDQMVPLTVDFMPLVDQVMQAVRERLVQLQAQIDALREALP